MGTVMWREITKTCKDILKYGLCKKVYVHEPKQQRIHKKESNIIFFCYEMFWSRMLGTRIAQSA
jgi:hypothetical protein